MALSTLLVLTSLLVACGDKDDTDDSGGDGGAQDGGADGGADGGGDGGGDGGSTGAVDADEDGYTVATDCDDTDPDVHPNATEVCNGKDDDCDDAIDTDAVDLVIAYPDGDGDGYGNPLAGGGFCPGEVPLDHVENGLDCRDSDPAINPDGVEVCDEANLDEDCDGLREDEDTNTHPDSMSDFFADMDGDGFGDGSNVIQGCDAGDIRSVNSLDCDDSDASAGPSSACAPFDGVWSGAMGFEVTGVWGYSGDCDDNGSITISDASSTQVQGTATCWWYTSYPITINIVGELDYPWGVTGYWYDSQSWWDEDAGQTELTGEFSEDGQTLTLSLWADGDFSGYSVSLEGDWMLSR